MGGDYWLSVQMTYIDLNSIEALKTFEYGLMIKCPLDGDPNPPFCQFHDIRLLPVEERFKWIDALSDEETVKHYIAHLNCYSERVAKNGLV
jgi:hypothetical protein